MRSINYRSPKTTVLAQEYKASNGGCVNCMVTPCHQAPKLPPIPAVYVPTIPRCSTSFVTP